MWRRAARNDQGKLHRILVGYHHHVTMAAVEVHFGRCLYFFILIFLGWYVLYRISKRPPAKSQNHRLRNLQELEAEQNRHINRHVNIEEFGAQDLVAALEAHGGAAEQEAVQCENIVPRPTLQGLTYNKLAKTDVKGGDLFAVQTKNVKTLKKICDALDECSGFNSNGWLKTKTESKYHSKVDLYVKETPQDELYLASEIIEKKYGKDYYQMIFHLKIFIYDIKTGTNITSPDDYKYGVETLFIDLLRKSQFVTQKPEEATFYFIPARCTAYRKSVPDRSDGEKRAARIMVDILQEVKHRWPFWKRSEGADHFYICAHDMGASVAAQADPNLLKNSVALVNTADYQDPYFNTHKDISLPPHPAHGQRSLPEVGQGGRGFIVSDRSILAFFAGTLDRGRIRPTLKKIWSHDPDFRVIDGMLPTLKYQRYLQTSKFCLFPRGNQAWSPRLMDAVWFGCIPVILSDYYQLPLHGLLDWTRLAIFVPEAKISHLKDILRAVSKKQIADMQIRLRQVYPHLTWYDPPQPYDAFHSVLFQLWQKRHVLRYLVNY